MSDGSFLQRPVQIVERVSTTEQVVRSLRAAIVSGRIAQGAQLREAQLAAWLGTGRGVVREAMRQLVQEGLAQHEVHRGTFVREITSLDIRDVYLAREAVELAAVELILDDPAPGLEPVRAALERMSEAAEDGEDWRVMADRDIALHEALVEASRSSRLVRMYATLAAESRMHLSRYPPYSQERNVSDHREIVDALETRDLAAVALLREHLRFSARLAVDWRGLHRGAEE
jgi:DNA-binding GntR family transcriptional regulator